MSCNPHRSSRRCLRALFPLLIVSVFPSCLTWQLWESGDVTGGFFAEHMPDTNGTLVRDAKPNHLAVQDPDFLGVLDLTGLSREPELARHLLAHPDLFEVHSATLVGHLDPRSESQSRAELTLSGKVRGDWESNPATRGRLGKSSSLRVRGELLEHRSTWRVQTGGLASIRPPVEREMPLQVQMSIQRRRPDSVSVPWRIMQVVLTPPVAVADLVVTPAVFVYYFFDRPRFLF